LAHRIAGEAVLEVLVQSLEQTERLNFEVSQVPSVKLQKKTKIPFFYLVG
jgi:hypothetical protein